MYSNSKFNCSETEKRPEKYAGGPAGWEKAGPLPLLFPTATPSALCGSLFGSLRNGSAVKKEKKGNTRAHEERMKNRKSGPLCAFVVNIPLKLFFKEVCP
jgi:hypothetical protein